MAQVYPQQEFKNLSRFVMYALEPGGSGKKSSLRWSIYGTNPRITINTNNEADKNVNYGMINAGMDPVTFFLLLDLLEKIAKDDTKPNKMKLDCLTTSKTDDGGRTQPFLNSEVWIGKDDEGICWISVVAKDRPKIKFNFTMSDYHKLHKATGGPFTESEISCMLAIATANALKEIYIRADMCGVVITSASKEKRDTSLSTGDKTKSSGDSKKSNYNDFEDMNDIAM